MPTTTPQQQFLAEVRAYLDENAGEHRRARYHVDVQRFGGTSPPTSFRGAGLTSEDVAALAQDLDFVGDVLLDGALKRFVNATEATAPIATVDLVFWKDGGTWHDRGVVHTVAERQGLEAARLPLDAQLHGALRELALPSFTTISLTRGRDKPLALTHLVERDATKPEVPAALIALDAAYQDFYRERSLALFSFTARLRSTTPDVLELDAVYGTPGEP